MPKETDKLTHYRRRKPEVRQLDPDQFNELIQTLKGFSKNLAKWQSIQNATLRDGLAAIALAASTPNDNSAEVKALTEKMKATTDALQAAVDQAPT